MSHCNSIHAHTGQQCIRQEGHDGYCYGKAERNAKSGTVTRAHWWSINGQFKSHHWYETKYPTNASREAKGKGGS